MEEKEEQKVKIVMELDKSFFTTVFTLTGHKLDDETWQKLVSAPVLIDVDKTLDGNESAAEFKMLMACYAITSVMGTDDK